MAKIQYTIFLADVNETLYAVKTSDQNCVKFIRNDPCQLRVTINLEDCKPGHPAVDQVTKKTLCGVPLVLSSKILES